MTYKISKTILDGLDLGDFAARAATHAVAMKEWRAHMARVKNDEAKGVTGIDKHLPHPRPNEHQLVEAAVNEKDEMDYEVINDGPLPEDILRAKKDALLNYVAGMEEAAVRKIVPPGRQRLYAMRDNAIAQSDTQAASDFFGSRGLLKKMASAVGIGDVAGEMSAEVTRRRPAEDQKHINEQNVRRSRIGKIRELAAKVMHDVEDLTIDSVDDFKIPNFEELK